jgi:hypothetical protein
MSLKGHFGGEAAKEKGRRKIDWKIMDKPSGAP